MLYRVINGRTGVQYRSRNQNGYYESRVSAERAILQLRKSFRNYSYEERRYVGPEIPENWTVQETETNWEVCE